MHTLNSLLSIVAGAFCFLALPNLAHAYYTICIEWDANFTDNNLPAPENENDTAPFNLFEDHYRPNQPNGDSHVLARGVLYDAELLLDTQSGRTGSNGCFTTPSKPSSVKIYANARNQGITVVKLTDAGTTATWLIDTSSKTGTTWTLTVGAGNRDATAIAAAGFAVYRNDLGLEDKTIWIYNYTPNPSTCDTWTSSLNPPSDYSTGLAKIQITKATTSCPNTEHRDKKFKITHEIGHALLRLGDGGQEDYEPFLGETDLLTNNQCTNGDWYGIQTLEHNVVSAKEGFPEFYSAIVWNNTSSGAGNLWGWNLELNPIWGDIHRTGGRISCGPANSNCQSGSPHADCCGGAFEGCWDCCCNPTSTDGKGTTIDWVRTLWDWHAPYGTGKASATLIRSVWGQMMIDHFSGAAPIVNEGDYYRRTKRAVGIEASSGLEDDWDYYADYNGINVITP